MCKPDKDAAESNYAVPWTRLNALPAGIAAGICRFILPPLFYFS
jgi:hypothetical protein